MKTSVTRKHFIALLLILGLVKVSYSQSSQVVFTVKPGLNLNGANVGMKTGNVEPYFGLQFANYSSKYTYNTNDPYDDDYERKTKVHIYMPYLGSKFFLLDNESLKTSINVTVFKPFIFGKEIIDGDENEDFKDDLKETQIIGAELGFGSEYFLSEHFSLGGEFGFRYAYIKDEHESSSGDYSYKDVLNLNMTYVSASLNYYF